jgi:outer membrane protein OmpA-like peptidoglycan-associated protein
MRKQYKPAVLGLLIVLLFPGLLPADLIVIQNGDRFFGKIENEHFAVHSAYGQIVLRYDFLKSISFDAHHPGHAVFISINNDRFSGAVLNDEFEIRLENGERKSISKKSVKRLHIDTRGPSHKIETAIFTMQNGDKLSGKLLNEDFKVNAGYMVKSISPDTINRIEFSPGAPGIVKVLLNNGDLIRGDMLAEVFEVVPETTGQLALDKPAVASIQLNAPKMVMKQYHSLPASDRDGDGDGVADHADKCPGSGWGSEVHADGCSKDPDLARGGPPADRDRDGVLDAGDRCPHTPAGVSVDERGCAKFGPVFFAFDRTDLQAEYRHHLEVVAAALEADPSMQILVQGHADNVGSAEYNRDLSERRAREVKWFIVNKGIEASRITTIGYGPAKSKAPNDTTQGRALNRRAEIVVVE